MNKFYYTRTYTFEVQQERPKHYFFNLMDRFGEVASFKRIDKKNNDVVPATIKIMNNAWKGSFSVWNLAIWKKIAKFAITYMTGMCFMT